MKDKNWIEVKWMVDVLSLSVLMMRCKFHWHSRKSADSLMCLCVCCVCEIALCLICQSKTFYWMYVYTRLQRFSSTASAIRKHMTHHSSRPKYIITKSQPPKLSSPNVLFYSAYHTPPVAAALICSKAFLSHTLTNTHTLSVHLSL